jgi:hypothetical protein
LVSVKPCEKLARKTLLSPPLHPAADADALEPMASNAAKAA